jgi:hypothetical protein
MGQSWTETRDAVRRAPFDHEAAMVTLEEAISREPTQALHVSWMDVWPDTGERSSAPVSAPDAR